MDNTILTTSTIVLFGVFVIVCLSSGTFLCQMGGHCFSNYLTNAQTYSSVILFKIFLASSVLFYGSFFINSILAFEFNFRSIRTLNKTNLRCPLHLRNQVFLI